MEALLFAPSSKHDVAVRVASEMVVHVQDSGEEAFVLHRWLAKARWTVVRIIRKEDDPHSCVIAT